MSRIKRPLHRKLTTAILLPLVLAIAASWLTGVWMLNQRLVGQVQEKVRTDLNAAREIYNNELGRLGDKVDFIGRTPNLAKAMAKGDKEEVSNLLDLLAESRLTSFMTVVDRFGQVYLRSGNPGIGGDSLKHIKPVADALDGRHVTATIIMEPEEAGIENPMLPERMLIKVRQTSKATRHGKVVERRGLFLVAASPILDQNGLLVGAVYAGKLLNGHEQIVERMTDVITDRHGPGEKVREAATIFLGEIRIATTVTDENDRRVTGTLMSSDVADAVLKKGKRWSDKAFVYNDWYYSAYEPIENPDGKRIGALYVGIPERPYLVLRRNINLIFAILMTGLSLTGFAVATALARRLSHPINALAEGARKIASGEKFEPVLLSSEDEIALLADEFGKMSRRLANREQEIQTLNQTLEQKVVERTRELEEKNSRLVLTEKELARSQRLAEIGVLSAGVAHEINNPLAIIRGNAELLQMGMQSEMKDEELQEILDQVGRINRIVSGLLTLARHENLQISRFDLSGLLNEIIEQIRYQIPLSGYTIDGNFKEKAVTIEADKEQLRQVFTNLILNAFQAMDGHGLLTITTDSESYSACTITVADTGPGIAKENLEHLFTPFFSTKKNGTGLGLAISWGIINNHGGTIEAISAPAAGARFIVTLPGTRK